MYNCRIGEQGEFMSKLVVISGPSGVGKGTVVKELKRIYAEKNEKLYLSISCTTRAMREGEEDGVSYYFISQEEFLEMLSKGEFLEYNQYGTGKYYGTPKQKVMDYLKQGYDVILEIDINGYRQIKNNFKESIGIFIMPPSIEEVEYRLRKRNTETDEVIKKRLEIAKEELANKDEYDYLVINDRDMQVETAQKVYSIMKK